MDPISHTKREYYGIWLENGRETEAGICRSMRAYYLPYMYSYYSEINAIQIQGK